MKLYEHGQSNYNCTKQNNEAARHIHNELRS